LKNEQFGQWLPFQTTLSYRVGSGSQLGSFDRHPGLDPGPAFFFGEDKAGPGSSPG
jgi:hypothetical protein